MNPTLYADGTFGGTEDALYLLGYLDALYGIRRRGDYGVYLLGYCDGIYDPGVNAALARGDTCNDR